MKHRIGEDGVNVYLDDEGHLVAVLVPVGVDVETYDFSDSMMQIIIGSQRFFVRKPRGDEGVPWAS